MLISVKLLTKYVIIIHALGSVHKNGSASESKRFQIRSKGEIPGGLGEKNRWAVPNWNRHS